MTNNNFIPIPGRLHDVSTNGVVAGADEIFDDAKGKRQSVINQETDAALDNKYDKDETYSKQELNNLITTPNQDYVTVPTYGSLPATGEADTIYRVSNYDGEQSQVDATKYSEYAWDGTQYVFLCVKTQIGEMFDITAYNSNTKYADLTAALGTDGANIPEGLRKGGMSVKYVQTSDNKYVQYRLKTESFSIFPYDWQEEIDEHYFTDKHQGYITSGKWKDLTSGNRYYTVLPIDIKEGETIVVKGNANYSSLLFLLSDYTPVEDGDAGVLQDISSLQNTEATYTAVAGAHYIYMLVTSSPNVSRIPQKLTIGPVDLLALPKDNIKSLLKYVDENNATFATKTELENKPDIKDAYLKKDIVMASGSKSVTGTGDIATVDIVANGGDTIKITMSGKDTVWGSARVYPILNGVAGSSIGITESESLIEVPEGGITQLRFSLGTGMFIASGTVNYTVSFPGIMGKINNYDQLYAKLNPISDNLALRSDQDFLSGSTTLSSAGSKNFFIEEHAGLKKGDQIRLTISGIGTVINAYRVYFVSTGSTFYTESPNILTVPFDTDYLKVGIGSGMYIAPGTVQWSVEKTGVNTRFEHLQEEIDANNIIERNKDIDDVVYASGWNNIGSTKEQVKLFQLLISGDIHGDGTRMQSIVTYLNSKSFINAGIMLGDLVGSNYTSDFSFYVPAIQNVNKPFITIAGNHDMGSEEDHTLNAPSMEAFYNRYYAPTLQYAGTIVHTSGKCYFYKDFADEKIRMIMINQYDYPDADLLVDGYQKGLVMYSQAQIDWLISTLNSTPSDYAVIIALHSMPDRMTPVNCDFTGRDVRTVSYVSPGTAISGDIIADIVNAWINGESLSQTYNITVTSALSSLSASADFTSRGEGEFVCYIGGHFHNYIISHDQAHTDQLSITVNNARCIARESDMPRLEGSKSEDAFAVLSVDRTNKKVKLSTVGARIANDLVVREIYSIGY